MQIEHIERTPRRPWNVGRKVGAKPPLKPKHIWSFRALLRAHGKLRDLAMLNLAVDSKLRGCDLVRLNITDLVVAGHVKSRATIVQKKTGTPVPFELTEVTRESVLAWSERHMPKEGRGSSRAGPMPAGT